MPKPEENVNVNNENQLNNDAANNNQPENIDVNAVNNNQPEVDNVNAGAPQEEQPEEEVKELPEGNYDDYKDINDLETLRTKEMNKASIKRAREILGFINPDVTDLYKKQEMVSGDEEIKKAFGNAHFHDSGNPRHYGIFVAYLMGIKELNFNQVMDLKSDSPEFSNYVTEFHDFLKAHPTNVKNVETKKTNVKLWTRMFMDCNKKLGETRMPDIDYSDPKQIREHADFFRQLQGAEIDVAQEFEMVTRKDGESLIYAQEEAGGTKQYSAAIDNWIGVQPKLISIMNSYNPDHFEPEHIWKNQPHNYRLATNARLQLSKIGQYDIKGRTIADIAGDTKGKDAARNLYAVMADSQFHMPRGVKPFEYLTGKDRSAENGLDESYQKSRKAGRQSFNSNAFESSTLALADEIAKFGIEQRKTGADIIPGLFGAFGNEATPQQMLDFIKGENGKDYREKLEQAYGVMTKELNMPEFYEFIGITDPISIIKIDGQSVTDMYAEKYAGINDPEDKKLLIMNEVFREAIYGDKKVTADVYVLDDNDKAVKFKPQVISKPAIEIDREMAFYSEVNDLHKKLKAIYDELKATQDDPNVDVTINKDAEGSTTYKDLMKALKTAVNCTALEGPSVNADISNLPTYMREVKKAASAYVSKHTGLRGLFKGYSKEKGIPRNNIAKKLKADEYEFSYDVKKVGDLYPMIGARNSDYFDPALTKTDLQLKWGRFKKTAASKGIDASVEGFENPAPETARLLDETNRRDLMRRTVADASEKRGMNLELLDNQLEVKPVEYARQFVKDKYEKAIKAAGKKKNVLSVDELAADILSDDFRQRFHAEADKLAADPQFIRLVKKDPAHCIEKWGKIIEKGDLGRHEILAEQSDVYKRLAAADPKNARDRWNKAEDTVDGWRREWKREDKKLQGLKDLVNDTSSNVLFDPTAEGHEAVKEDAYRRLGDIIALSTIKDYIAAKNEEAAVELALHPEEVQNIRSWIVDGLKKDNVLESRETANEALNNIKALKVKAIDNVHAADTVKERNSVGPVHKNENEMDKNVNVRPRSNTVTPKSSMRRP
ncbi:hypothetical protein SAMN04487934_104148 [Eubacterium ruminantium]|nr:hypothetical protein SAMN04487934_104148 [Eubacterium ruminantium]